MNTVIVVPVDFSPAALAAAKYALMLAAAKRFSVYFIHVFPPLFRDGRARSSMADAGQIASSAMEVFMDKLPVSLRAEVLPQTECLPGKIAEVILRRAKELVASMILMGTKGASGLKYILLGSNAFEIVRKANVPVLVVPESISRFQLKTLGFFSDYQYRDAQALHVFVSLFGNEIAIKLHHIIDTRVHPEGVQKKLQQWAGYLSADLPPLQLTTHVSSSEDTVAEVERIAQEEELDMLLLTLADRDFFEKLMTKSVSRTIVHQPYLPVLLVNQ